MATDKTPVVVIALMGVVALGFGVYSLSYTAPQPDNVRGYPWPSCSGDFYTCNTDHPFSVQGRLMVMLGVVVILASIAIIPPVNKVERRAVT
jgi:hypothetical protein